MIYTITLNPSIDYVIQAKSLELGTLNKINNEAKYPGGKGINVSRVLHELRYENTALGFLGGFTGDYVAEQLQQQSIRTNFIPINGETRINVKLKSDTETEINGRGPEIRTAEREKLMQQLERITEQDTVVLSGSAPPSLPNGFYKQLVKQIVRSGASFVMDTTGNDLKSILPYQPLLVKPNLDELRTLFHAELRNQDEVIAHGKKLRDMGAYHAIVSMAGDGALLFTETGIYRAYSPKGETKNSVGAGDSMIAGFIGMFNKTGNVVESFRMGMAAGSATAFSADLAVAKDIQALCKEIKITRMS